MFYAYLFEVRGIQRFLFSTGKLRDMLAGSELLDHVCASNGLLDITLQALQLEPTAIPRRAGATFYLVFAVRQDAERFRSTWRLAFTQWVPGVESVDALVEGESTQQLMHLGITALSQGRNRLQADLPRPGPLSDLSPRTGLAAIRRKAGESMDRSTSRLRQFQRPAGIHTLEQRFLDEPGYHWPCNFEAQGPQQERFPLLRSRMVGLIHADGNGIGQILRTLSQATEQASNAVHVEIYRGFSDNLARITQVAAQVATRSVLLPQASSSNVLPARPLVLGGDDMSILVRADLALDYTRSFLEAFETESKVAMLDLQRLLERHGLSEDAKHLPDRLTASAGICYIKCSYPFQAAHALAESLCKRAKAEARRVSHDLVQPATIAFHKMEGAMAEDADALFHQFHRVQTGQQNYQLALSAYSLKPAPGLPCVDDLVALAGIFDGEKASGINDRPLRELATLWRQDIAVTRQAYARWRQISLRAHPKQLQEFDRYLQRLLGSTDTLLPATNGDPGLSPLSDLLSWLSIHTSARNVEVSP